MEASQTFKDKRSRLTKEQRERVTPELVEEIMEKHVSPNIGRRFEDGIKPSFGKSPKATFLSV